MIAALVGLGVLLVGLPIYCLCLASKMADDMADMIKALRYVDGRHIYCKDDEDKEAYMRLIHIDE